MVNKQREVTLLRFRDAFGDSRIFSQRLVYRETYTKIYVLHCVFHMSKYTTKIHNSSTKCRRDLITHVFRIYVSIALQRYPI